MKKYFLAMAAIVLAIGFSAFTTEKSNDTNKSFDSYYWYNYDADNDALDGFVDHTTRDLILNDPCDESSGTECLRGFDAEQDEFDQDPAAGASHVYKP